MASSPPPSFPPSLPNPKKRQSMSSQASTTSAAKRRQLHPLRQTSFPASGGPFESAATQSARSETGSMATSTFSTTSSKLPGRGRGRPRKNAPLPAHDGGDNASKTGQSTAKGRGAKSVVSAKSGAGAPGGGESDAGDDDDDDDDDEAEIEITADEKQRDQEEDKRRTERERRLVMTFKGDTEKRYHQARSLRIEPKNVRRIINQVMSQSSGEKVVSAISWTSKLFTALMIEGARDVQNEWAAAYDVTRAQEKEWRRKELARLIKKREEEGTTMGEQQNVLVTRDIDRLTKEVDQYIPNPHRAGLLPDHLRESLRRYKANGEGYGAGMQGASHSLLGITGSATYRVGDGTTGRRLFR